MKQLMIIGIVMLLTPIAIQAATTDKAMLSLKEKSIVEISAFISTGDTDKLYDAINAGLDKGLTICEIKEVMVQMYAYCGFPRALNALNIMMRTVEERKSAGKNDVEGVEASPITHITNMSELGETIRTALVGRPVTGKVYEFCPIIDEYLRSHLFGDIFARDNFSHQYREIATVGALAGMGLETQLRSQLGICRNIGYSENQLRDFANVIITKVGSSNGATVNRVLDEIFNKETAEAPIPVTSSEVKDVFAKGKPLGENPNFTGEAWLKTFVTKADSMDCTVGNVTFAPSVRNSWHSHPGGQILLCTSGKGYYQEKGMPIRLLLPGDVVKIAPNVIHWHGATPDSEFTHIAIGTQTSKGGAQWYGAVTDEVYNSFNNK